MGARIQKAGCQCHARDSGSTALIELYCVGSEMEDCRLVRDYGSSRPTRAAPGEGQPLARRNIPNSQDGPFAVFARPRRASLTDADLIVQ